MTGWELFRGGAAHDAALETIGYGAAAIPPAAIWSYQQFQDGKNE
jgi:hypothetical protein